MWKSSGKWADINNKANEEFNIAVPMPDGTMAPIKHLSVTNGKEALGVFHVSVRFLISSSPYRRKPKFGLRENYVNMMLGSNWTRSSSPNEGMDSVVSPRYGQNWTMFYVQSGGNLF